MRGLLAFVGNGKGEVGMPALFLHRNEAMVPEGTAAVLHRVYASAEVVLVLSALAGVQKEARHCLSFGRVENVVFLTARISPSISFVPFSLLPYHLDRPCSSTAQT